MIGDTAEFPGMGTPYPGGSIGNLGAPAVQGAEYMRMMAELMKQFGAGTMGGMNAQAPQPPMSHEEMMKWLEKYNPGSMGMGGDPNGGYQPPAGQGGDKPTEQSSGDPAKDKGEDKDKDGKDDKTGKPLTGDPFGGGPGWYPGSPGLPMGPGGYNPGSDPIFNPANYPGNWGGAKGDGSGVGGSGQWGGGGNPATDKTKPPASQNPTGAFDGSNPQGPGGNWWNPGGGTGQFGNSGDPFGTGNTSQPPTNQPPPDRNPPKPQPGGPGATQPTWQDLLGPNGGIPPPGQPYAGGYAGGLPGMGGGYNTAPNLGGPASDPAAAKAAQDFLKGTINEFQSAQDRANAANEQRYQQGLGVLSGLNTSQDQMLGGLANLYGQRNTDFGTGMGNVVGASQGLLDDWLQRSGLIGQGYDALNQRVMDRTGLMGYQQGQAINQAYDRQNAQAEQDLVSRGLSNTTIRPTVQRGIEADRTRALTGLAEDVNNQFNQLDMGTTNPALQFGERAGQFASQLGQGTVGAMQQGVTGLAGLQGDALQFGERANQARQNLGNNIVNWIGSRNDQGPDFNTLAQLALGVGASGAGYGSIPALPAGSGTGNAIPNPQVPYYNPSSGQTSGTNSQYQSPPFVPTRPVANTGSTARYATTF